MDPMDVTDAARSGQDRLDRSTARAGALREQAQALLDQAERIDKAGQAIAKGNDGERIVGALLDGLRPFGWAVLHDRRKSPASPTNVDHVLVGPPGIFVIDTKNWSGGKVRLDDRGMRVGSWRKDDALHAVRVDADIVAEQAHAVLPGARACGTLAFVNDMGLDGPQLHQGVVVLERTQLLGWLQSLAARLSPAQVAAVGDHLDAVLPPRATRLPAQRAPEQAPEQQRVSPMRAGVPTSRPAQAASSATSRRKKTRAAPAAAPPTNAQAKRARRKKSKARAQLVKGGLVLLVLLLAASFPDVFASITGWVGGQYAERTVPQLEQLSPPAAPAAPPAR